MLIATSIGHSLDDKIELENHGTLHYPSVFQLGQVWTGGYYVINSVDYVVSSDVVDTVILGVWSRIPMRLLVTNIDTFIKPFSVDGAVRKAVMRSLC